MALLPEREAVRTEIPHTSWQDFLKLEAGNGNEIALAVLRSRKEAVESESATELERSQSTPRKRIGAATGLITRPKALRRPPSAPSTPKRNES